MPSEVTKTIGSNGRDYATLTLWEAAQNGDLTGVRDEIAIAECYNDSVLADTLTVDGWVTDTTRYIKITAPVAQRHHGMPYTGFRIYPASGTSIRLNDGNVWVEGISFIGGNGVYCNETANPGFVKVSKCLMANGNYAINFIPWGGLPSAHTGYFWNNTFIECNFGVQYGSADEETYTYNCSAYRCNRGYYVPAAGAVTVVKNCVSIDGLTTDFSTLANFDAASDYNASTAAVGDADRAPGAHSVHSVAAVDNYSNLQPGIEDLHIVDNGADLYGAGDDLSGDLDLSVTDDIDGNARSNWDIGSDEYSASPPAGPDDATTSTSTVGTIGKDYATLTLWEAAKNGNLKLANSYEGGVEIAECYNTGVMTDNLTIDGWTTDVHCYIKIYTPSDERHGGLLNAGFQLDGGAASAIDVRDGNVLIDGISITTTGRGIYGDASANPGWLKVSNCVLDGCNFAIDYIPGGVLVGWFRGFVWNNFILNSTRGINVAPAAATGRKCFISNNSIYGCDNGIFANDSDIAVAKNNAVLGNTNDFQPTANFHADSDYNASTAAALDADAAPGAHSIHSIAAADNFTDLTGGLEDLHIINTVADIYQAGINLASDSDLAVLYDIDGILRDDWDIGGDYYYVSTPITIQDSLPDSIRIDGRTLRDFSIELTSYTNSLLTPLRERLQTIGARSGSRNFGAIYDISNLNVAGQFQADSHREFVENKTAFLRWVDVEQHLRDEWLVGGNAVKALKLELAGHRFAYSAGTASVIYDSRIVTGSGTSWLSYISPNATIRFKGLLQQRYTVQQVNSDTQLILSIPYQGATEVGISYEVERQRFLAVQYNGTSFVSAISSAHFRDDTFDFSIGFRSAYPYWIGSKFEKEESNTSAGEFIELYGIGTAPFNPVYQIMGAATNPEICACEMAFHCNFNGNVNARTILNKAVVAGTTSANYEPTRNNKGIYLTDPNNATWASVPGYADKFSCLVRLRVKFASTAAGDRYAFEYRYDANNGFALFYDASDDDWVLNVRSGGADDLTIRTANTQVFASGDEVEISCWYDSDGRSIEGTTYYGKIFVNGVEAGSVTSLPTKPTGNPVSLYVGSTAGSANFIDSVVDELALFVIALQDEDCISAYTSGEPISNLNATISYAGTVAANDVLTIYSYCGEADYFDSIQEETSRVSALSGFEASLRGTKEEFGLIYLPAAISGKFRIIYHPHFK